MHHKVTMAGRYCSVTGCCQPSVSVMMKYLDAVASVWIIDNDTLQDLNTGIRGGIVNENKL